MKEVEEIDKWTVKLGMCENYLFQTAWGESQSFCTAVHFGNFLQQSFI